MKKINIGIESWVIQDGNYGDFQTGKTYQFALEFYPESYKKTKKRVKEYLLVEEAKINIVGEIVFADSKSWVIDFGFKAYNDGNRPSDFNVGDWIESTIYLGIDHYDYFENFRNQKNYPNLFYNWTINKIEMETTPLIEIGPKTFARDQNRIGFKEINKTNGWEDFNGQARYIFTCTHLENPQGIEIIKHT